MTLVDTNILIDILEVDPTWAEQSALRLAERERVGSLAINAVIYAELAAGFAGQAALDAWVVRMRLLHAPLSKPTLFLAGQAFRKYRRAGGPRTNVLADFFIGAQASVEGWPILTRDARRYRTYFPEVTLIGA